MFYFYVCFVMRCIYILGNIFCNILLFRYLYSYVDGVNHFDVIVDGFVNLVENSFCIMPVYSF